MRCYLAVERDGCATVGSDEFEQLPWPVPHRLLVDACRAEAGLAERFEPEGVASAIGEAPVESAALDLEHECRVRKSTLPIHECPPRST